MPGIFSGLLLGSRGQQRPWGPPSWSSDIKSQEQGNLSAGMWFPVAAVTMTYTHLQQGSFLSSATLSSPEARLPSPGAEVKVMAGTAYLRGL